MKKNVNWYYNPTKKTLIIFSLICLIGNLLLLLSLSDLFTENIFVIKNILMLAYMIGSISSVVKLYTNYAKMNKVDKLNKC